MGAGETKFSISLRTILAGCSAIGVVTSLLSFTIGRASVVSDLRKEMSEKYVERAQYATDQTQQAAIIQHNYSEVMKQLDALREDQRSIILLLTRNRKIVADSLLAEPN